MYAICPILERKLYAFGRGRGTTQFGEADGDAGHCQWTHVTSNNTFRTLASPTLMRRYLGLTRQSEHPQSVVTWADTALPWSAATARVSKVTGWQVAGSPFHWHCPRQVPTSRLFPRVSHRLNNGQRLHGFGVTLGWHSQCHAFQNQPSGHLRSGGQGRAGQRAGQGRAVSGRHKRGGGVYNLSKVS